MCGRYARDYDPRVPRFPFVHRETVRFRDLDALGHVNNAVYLTYLEQARVAFLTPAGYKPGDMILARAEIDFRSALELRETVEVRLSPTRVGTKSFELGYELRVGDRLVAEAKTVIVAYDYELEESKPLPDAWRKLLSE
jgi:acyl-CoA thioester hydrolase